MQEIEMTEEEFKDNELFEQILINNGIDPTKGYCVTKRGDEYFITGLGDEVNT